MLKDAQIALVLKAMRFAEVAHKGQKYGDHPYTYHLNGVADLVEERNTESEMVCMLLMCAHTHDLLEDTDTRFIDLVDEFGYRVAEVVRRLTKVKGEKHEDYMKKVLESPLAVEVKKCDTMFNLYSSFTEGNTKRIAKYIKQLDILERGYV